MKWKWSNIWIYALLIIGSAVFAFPFLWMASTSVKVDRELFTDDIRLKPLTPSAATISPYVDTQYYAELSQNLALFQKYKAIRNSSGYAGLNAAQKKIMAFGPAQADRQLHRGEHHAHRMQLGLRTGHKE